VTLSRDEAFAACQALADADRRLVGFGCAPEAGALGALFELLEDRLTSDPAPTPYPQSPSPRAASPSGSYSMESEFTQ
jgi:hypothetical protein